MSDTLSICNGALLKIGVPRIQGLSEQTKEARACNSEFDKARETLLRLYPWGFASGRVTLAPDPVPPPFEYEYALALPADCLRIVELYQYEGQHKVEGRYLLANSDVIYLKYVKDITDMSKADSLFIACLEWWLGYNLSRYLTESETVRQEAFAGFKSIMPMAKFVQSTENSQPELESYDLIHSRSGRGFVRDPGT